MSIELETGSNALRDKPDYHVQLSGVKRTPASVMRGFYAQQNARLGFGDDNLAAGYDAEADFVRNSVNATLFDAKTGLYDISDAVRGPAAQDANALAVLWRVAPASQQTSILQGLRSALYTQNGPLAFSPGTVFPGPFGPSNAPSIISPFISGFEARARFEAGDTGGALDLIRTVWGHMRQGGSFYSGATWEVLAPDGTVANGAGGTSWLTAGRAGPPAPFPNMC